LYNKHRSTRLELIHITESISAGGLKSAGKQVLDTCENRDSLRYVAHDDMRPIASGRMIEMERLSTTTIRRRNEMDVCIYEISPEHSRSTWQEIECALQPVVGKVAQLTFTIISDATEVRY